MKNAKTQSVLRILNIETQNKSLLANRIHRKSMETMVTRKQFERRQKLEKTSRKNEPKVQIKENIPSKDQTKKDHDKIYQIPLKKMQKIEGKIMSQLRQHNKKIIQRQNIDTELYVQSKVLFEVDKFVCLDLYCRSFQLAGKKEFHKDISWLKLMKR